MEFRILGPIEAVDGDRSVALGGGKQRALLALLLLNANRVVSVERFVDELWGENVPETGRKMVQIYVSQLRKALSEGRIRTQAPGYSIELADAELDLRRFEQAVEDGRSALAGGDAAGASQLLALGLSLWRGPALAELEEPFARYEGARLEELRLSAVEDRIEADLLAGLHADLVGELGVLIQRYPLRERFRGQQMLALYRARRQAEALSAYQDFRSLLDEQLGIQPSQTLRELERRILQQDQSLELPPARVDATARDVSRAASDAGVAGDPFVGRNDELERLSRFLDEALAGRRQIVFVSGEAGIGKTTLVEAFLRTAVAKHRIVVARGQCIEHRGAGEAYLPVLEALGRLGRDPDAPSFAALLSTHAPTWLAQLPALVRPEDQDVLHARIVGATRERMLREMAEALDEFARAQPFVLAFEDVQWADYSTLDLLEAVARRGEPGRFLILATHRPTTSDEAAHVVGRVERNLRLRGLAVELRVPALVGDAVVDYLAARLPGAAFPSELPSRVAALTGGNPLFLEKIVDTWIDHGCAVPETGGWRLVSTVDELLERVPGSLRQLFEQRLHDADPTEQMLLEAASVAGSEFSAAIVAAACEQSDDEAEQRLGALARAGAFIQPRGDEAWPDGTVSARFGFTHDVCFEVIYDAIPAGRRARLHRRSGARLEAAYGERASEVAVELASHFVRGGDAEHALLHLRLAAERALGRNAHREAIDHVSAGLELLERLAAGDDRDLAELGLRIRLGQALIGVAGWASPEAEGALARARELSEQLGRTQELATSLFLLGTMYEVRGDYRRSQSLLESSLALPEPAGASLLVDSREVLACSLFHQGAFERALDQAEQGLGLWDGRVSPLTAAFGDNPGVACHTWAALSLWFLGRTESADRRALEAVALARARLPEALAFALAQAAIVAQLRSQPAEALERAEGAIEAATSSGHQLRLAAGTIVRGWALAARGEGEAGVAELRQGLELARSTGARMDDPYYLGLLAEAYTNADEPQLALDALAEGLSLVRASRAFFYEPELHRLRGRALMALDRPSDAEAAFAEAYARARANGARSLELRAAIDLGRRWLDGERRADATRMVAEAYETLVEGFDDDDRVQARSLLEEAGAAVPSATRPEASPDSAGRTPVRYTRSGALSIAYQISGAGPDVVLVPGFVSHLEKDWEEPRHARFLDRLGTFSRLIRFDKRGTGLSDRPGGLPDLEARMDDLRAVMDEVGCDRSVLFGYSEGGPLSILFSATYPDRVASLVLYGAFAKRVDPDADYPWAPTRDARAAYIERLVESWGYESAMHAMCPSADDAMARWWGERCRAAASPGAIRDLMEMNSGIDVREVLPTIHVPTLVLHRTDDVDVSVEEGRYLGRRIEGARYVELPGSDHFVAIDPDQILDVVEPFVAATGSASASEPEPERDDRVLATILVTDIVASTETAVRLGDRSWAALLSRHHAEILRALTSFSGELVDTAGDGCLALFDGPSRAIRCARAIRDGVRPLGLTIRVGVHTGEIERHRTAARGIAIHVAARVAAEAAAGEVLVTETTRDLVAGSGLAFDDRGERLLKGLDEPRRLFAATF